MSADDVTALLDAAISWIKVYGIRILLFVTAFALCYCLTYFIVQTERRLRLRH